MRGLTSDLTSGMVNMVGVKDGGEKMLGNMIPHSGVSTEEKRRYLRNWAKERAGGDPAKLPIIREAKAEIKRHFGDIPGAGLGTDLITRELREVRAEMTEAMPLAQPADKMARLARLVEMMAKEGIHELRISLDGDILSMKKFEQS